MSFTRRKKTAQKSVEAMAQRIATLETGQAQLLFQNLGLIERAQRAEDALADYRAAVIR